MFRERLLEEFALRRAKNARYSLRAFAAFLGTDHSSLGRILRGARCAPQASIRSWARKLGMTSEEASLYIAAGHVPDEASARRQHQLRHWTAEALAIVREPAHWEIVRLSRTPEFRSDCCWIAEQAGLTVDQINVALSRLLRLGLLADGPSGAWVDLTGSRTLTERQFR